MKAVFRVDPCDEEDRQKIVKIIHTSPGIDFLYWKKREIKLIGTMHHIATICGELLRIDCVDLIFLEPEKAKKEVCKRPAKKERKLLSVCPAKKEMRKIGYAKILSARPAVKEEKIEEIVKELRNIIITPKGEHPTKKDVGKFGYAELLSVGLAMKEEKIEEIVKELRHIIITPKEFERCSQAASSTPSLPSQHRIHALSNPLSGKNGQFEKVNQQGDAFCFNRGANCGNGSK